MGRSSSRFMTASASGVRGSALLGSIIVAVDYTMSTNRCQLAAGNGSYSILTEFGEDIRVVSAAPRRILVVDDDPMVATTIQRVLRPEGYDVDVALGGAEAVERARAARAGPVVL